MFCDGYDIDRAQEHLRYDADDDLDSEGDTDTTTAG